MLTLLLSAVAFAVSSGQALAATLSFTGGFSADWNRAANWTSSGGARHAVPTAVDDVLIPFGANPVLSAGVDGAARSVVLEPGASLSVSGRTLAVAGGVPSTFGGAVTIAAGAVLAVSGNSALSPEASMTGAGTLRLDGGTFSVATAVADFAPGTLLLSGGFLDLAQDSTVGRLTSDGEGGGRRGAPNRLTAGGPTVLDNVTFESSVTTLNGPSVIMRQVNLSAAIVSLGETAETLWDSGTWDLFGSRIENAGSLRITGDTSVANRVSSTLENTGTITREDGAAGGVASIRAGLLNDGEVDVVSGDLELGGSSADTSGGTFNVDAPGVLSVTGAPVLSDDGEITGDGTVRLDGGTLKVPPGDGVFDPGTVVFSGGFLNLGRNATVGRLTSDGEGGGRVSGAGTLNAGGPTRLDNVLFFDGTTNLTGPAVTLGDLTVTSSRLTLAPTAKAVWDSGDWQLSDAIVSNAGELRITGTGTAADAGDRPLVDNTGTLIRDAAAAGGVVSITAGLRNSGVVRVVDGTLGLGVSAEQTAGRTAVDAGAVLGGLAAHYTVTGGRVEGSGTIAGVLENTGGTVAAGTSPGRLSVDGDYLQSADGTLEAEVAGADPGTGYDQLSVSGAASLGGTLNIVTAAGFSPPFGSVYDVLVAGTLSGRFDAIAGAELADRAYTVEQDPAAGRVRLSIAAEAPAPPEGGAPSIPGTAQSGDTVACNPGAWAGEPTSFEYQWLRNGAAITGETSAGYTLTADDIEQTIQCQVVAINDGGRSDPALSNALVPTAPPPPPLEAPTNVALPTVTGTPVKGQTLRCAPGTWTGEPVLTYQWLLDGAAATGRTGSSYLVRGRDVGHVLACRVTAGNTAGTASATSVGVGVRAALNSR